MLVHCRRQRQEFANYEILSDARSDTIHYCDEISTSVALRGNVDASKWKQRIAASEQNVKTEASATGRRQTKGKW